MEWPDWTNSVCRLTLAAFHRFSDLPPEVRLLVWEFAIPGPRLVYVERVRGRVRRPSVGALDVVGSRFGLDYSAEPTGLVSSNDGAEYISEASAGEAELEEDSLAAEEIRFSHKSYCPVPSLLHVCRESRTVASRYFSLALSSVDLKSQSYFNFDRDILYIDHRTFDLFNCPCNWTARSDGSPAGHCSHVDPIGLSQVKFLATRPMYDDPAEIGWLRRTIEVIPGLETIAIVIADLNPEDLKSELVLVPPIDVFLAIHHFKAYRTNKHHFITFPGHMYWKNADDRIFGLKQALWDADRQRAEQAGIEPVEPRAEITYKAVTTAKHARSLSDAIEEFEYWDTSEIEERRSHFGNAIDWWVKKYLPRDPDY